MAKDKNKNQSYGTFLTRKNGFLNTTRQRAALIILAVVFIGGSAAAAYKGIDSLRAKKQAAVAETPTLPQIPAWWQQQYFGSAVCEKDICQAEADPDKDKLTNAQEFYYHTQPLNSNTVQDELTDGELVAKGFDPSKSGRMTFEEATSQDNILGESLVFGEDLKSLINETADISNISLPTVKPQEIKVSQDSQQRISDYLNDFNELLTKHFPTDHQEYIEQAIASRDPSRIADVQQRLYSAELELRAMTVPVSLSTMHRYSIMFIQTLSKVVDVPTQGELENEADIKGNMWYESTQALALLYQKMDTEIRRLNNLK